MADGKAEENPSGDKSHGETNDEIDEDEEEMEFPFDLSEEWMVIDVDDEDGDDEIKKSDSLSEDTSVDKDSTSKSQGKDPQNTPKTKSSIDKSKVSPKKSTEKPRNVKKEEAKQVSSTPKKSSSAVNPASTNSKTQAALKPVSSQESKRPSKVVSSVTSKSLSNQLTPNANSAAMKQGKSPSKSDLDIDSSKMVTRAASSTESKVINEKASAHPKTSQKAVKDLPGKTNDKANQKPTSNPETSASSTKTPSSQKTSKPTEKMPSGKTNNNDDQTSKSSVSSTAKTQTPTDKIPSEKKNNDTKPTSKSPHQETSASSTKDSSSPKLSDKTSSGKANNSTKQTSNCPPSESSASSTKEPLSSKTPKLSDKTSMGKTSNSTNQKCTANSQTTQAQKPASSLSKASQNRLSSENPQKAARQSQGSSNKKDDASAKEKITIPKSDNKPNSKPIAVKVTSTSTASGPSAPVSTKSATPTQKVCTSGASSHQVHPGSANGTVSKASGVQESAKIDDQKRNSSKTFSSPDSKKIMHGDVKPGDVTSSNKKHSVDPGKQKSAQKPVKPARNPGLTGEIAEVMVAGGIGSCGIKVHDLDSVSKRLEKKSVQSKPVHGTGLLPQKRPSQSSCENAIKKAKYEEKDDIKGSKPDEKELSLNKQSTKRIVRRFHRTTQTASKTTANQLVQCSLGLPSGSSSKRQSDFGLQCKIGENFEDDVSRISSHLTPFVNAINQDVFKAILAFDASSFHQGILIPATFKYGLRLGQVTQADVEKNFFKECCFKKADSYSHSFLEKDCGIIDLLFYEEENFIHVINQFRKYRLESRYLCISMLKRQTKEEKDTQNLWDHLKVTVVYDQNFISTGYLSYYKAPIWNKPKVDEFVTLHNVPGGIPLSFLNLVIPDAITILMRDVKAKYTRRGGGVRLGMNRKISSSVFLQLFKQIFVNNFPVVLTQGLSDKRNVPETKGYAKIVDELEKLELERQREKLHLHTLIATSRDINDPKKMSITKSEEYFSNVADESFTEDPVKGSEEAPLEVDSDLSDISELSFNANNYENRREDVGSSKLKQDPPQKKVEQKKSLNVTMGSKLLSRARTNLHQAKSKRQERESGKRPANSHERRKKPEPRKSPNRLSKRSREDSSRTYGTTSNRSSDTRRDESRRRDESGRRDSSRQERSRSRKNGSIDRTSESHSSRHGQRGGRDLERNRGKHVSPVRHFGRPRSNNRSSEREVLLRSSNKMPRSQERRISADRVRMREEVGGNYMEYGHPPLSTADLRDKRVSLENPRDIISDLRKSSEDLRAVLDARKPTHYTSQRGYENEEGNRFGNPGRQRRSPSQERRKRPLSRSPSPRYRKVMIGRRSLSPRNQSRGQRTGDFPRARMTPPSRPEMEVQSRDTMRNNVPDSRSVQASKQPHGSERQQTKEESMRISKSLFVKLLSNVLNSDGEGDENSHQNYSSHGEETGRMLSQLRGQENRSGKDERSFRQRPPSFEGDRAGHYGPPGASKGNVSGGDVRPIPPPVLPPILTSSSMSNNLAGNRPPDDGPSTSGPQVPQGVWAAPSSSSFTFPMSMPGNVRQPPPMTERPPPFVPPPPQNRLPFNTQPPMMFLNTRLPFQQPPQGPPPNIPRGIPPPVWQNRPPGPF